ncbi:MAG: DUF1385 domain-containing protein [Anaerolineae bacterium]
MGEKMEAGEAPRTSARGDKVQAVGEFHYGGQAVLEGVMMRGRSLVAIAVRNPRGEIVVHTEPLTAKIYTSRWGQLPFVRGLGMLWDALGLGIRALLFSADVALDEEGKGEATFSGPLAWGTVALSLAFGVALFFVLPLLLVGWVDRYIHSALVSNLLEGAVRIAIFLGYLAAVGLLPDIRRTFAYHGAEHKTINAYEEGEPLEVARIQRHTTAHIRCGTAFLLWVVVVSILLFALLGRPPLALRILSRILLLPVIAGLSYEMIRFSARHKANPLVRALAGPSLALQRLTTREPSDDMVEVAIAALRPVLQAEARFPGGPAQDSEPQQT